ncbi:hypothetical protein AB723_19580, partial [Acinetobacter baumannii]|uniref:protease inhibitor I9 family protein n=1 Tax=Acinetobacter baumannii TaxID=470 RepID=UPI000E2D238C
HGFAARLNAAQAAALEKMDGVLGIYPETIYELHTTRSPEFLGLDAVTAMQPDGPNYGEDVVVGVLDTGIWPESKSFNDMGLGPVPLHWKGMCETGTKFKANVCNKKIVGARFFSNGYEA